MSIDSTLPRGSLDVPADVAHGDRLPVAHCQLFLGAVSLWTQWNLACNEGKSFTWNLKITREELSRLSQFTNLKCRPPVQTSQKAGLSGDKEAGLLENLSCFELASQSVLLSTFILERTSKFLFNSFDVCWFDCSRRTKSTIVKYSLEEWKPLLKLCKKSMCLVHRCK